MIPGGRYKPEKIDEPYTDQEFENRKGLTVYQTSCDDFVTQKDYDRLIATVDSLKDENAQFVTDKVRLLEEKMELKKERDFWKHTAAKWMPGKEGKELKAKGWGKNYPGLN